MSGCVDKKWRHGEGDRRTSISLACDNGRDGHVRRRTKSEKVGSAVNGDSMNLRIETVPTGIFTKCRAFGIAGPRNPRVVCFR